MLSTTWRWAHPAGYSLTSSERRARACRRLAARQARQPVERHAQRAGQGDGDVDAGAALARDDLRDIP